MAQLCLSVLKSFQATLAEMPVAGFRSVKTQALLAYLMVESDRSHRRDVLAGLLWPNQPERAAQHNLSQSLLNLRTMLGNSAYPPFFLITRQTLQFNPACDHWLDIAELTGYLKACQTHVHADPQRCEFCMQQRAQAVDCYRGPFLAEFSLAGSDLFEEWALLKREWLHRQIVEALDLLVESYVQQVDHQRAERYARRLVELEPLREASHRRLMRVLALSGQRGAALAQYEVCRRILAAELDVEPADETTALNEQIRANRLQFADSGVPPGEQGVPPRVAASQQLWNETPDLGSFYGRAAELVTLQRWLVTDRCRVVTLLGMGGIGKTSLAARLTGAVRDRFVRVVWRSLLNAPPLDEILRDCIQALSAQPQASLPTSLDARLDLLLGLLREQRCLLVLDNLESILQTGARAGTYRAGYADYGQLIERIGQSQHMSCLLLTSREHPLGLERLDGAGGPVRTLQLAGLSAEDGRSILRERGLREEDAGHAALVARYSGNPLALKLVAATIRDLFGGNSTAFLRDETAIFDDIRDVLDQQFTRLSELERELIIWLAIAREPITTAALQSSLVQPEPQRVVLETLRSLQRRSLLEQQSDGFTLQNVVMEYAIDLLVTQIVQEIEAEAPLLLARHALTGAQAAEYVRQSQIGLILAPIADRLRARLSEAGVVTKIRALLELTRARALPLQGYVAGNLLQLLIQLGVDLRGSDFSRLAVRHVYLRGVALPEVSLAGADLSGSVFTDAFGIAQPLAFSPDGHTLVTSDNSGAIRWHRVADSQLIRVSTGHSLFVWSVAFSHDGALLASASEDQAVRIWDARSGLCLHTMSDHQQWVKSVDWLPNSAILASASGDQTVRIWDARSGVCLHIFRTPGAAQRSVACAPDGVRVASCGDDGAVYVWDVRTKELIVALRLHTDWVRSVVWSPDGEVLVSGGNDQSIQVWDARTYAPLRTLSGHSNFVVSLAFHPSGRLLASASNDETVLLWDLHTGQIVQTLHDHTSRVFTVVFHPSGTQLWTAQDQAVRVWDAVTGQLVSVLRGYPSWAEENTFSGDGTLLAAGVQDQAVRVWDTATGGMVHSLDSHTSWVHAVAFSRDGLSLASASADRTIRLWDVRSGQLLRMFYSHTHLIRALAWSADAAQLASGEQDGTIRLWDAGDGTVIRIFQGHTGRAAALTFGADGATLWSGSYDRTVRGWEIATGRPIYTLQGHTDWVQVIVAGTGGLLASAGGDMTIRLWESSSGRSIHTLIGHTSTVGSLAFSPDGRRLASGSFDQTVRIWDVPTGTAVVTLRGHTSWIRGVAWSADGATLVSSSSDETIRHWDARTGVCLRTVRSAGPYDGMRISGATGLTEAQRYALIALGAVER